MEKSVFLDRVHQYLNLLAIYLNNKEARDLKLDEKQLAFFYKLSNHHSLRVVYYSALKETKVDIPKEYLDKLEEYYLFNVRKVALFEKERKELYQYLNDNKIDFLPLKGLVLTNYYPDKYIREFADNDILFLDKKSDLVKSFFVKHGYEVEVYKRSNHDVYLKKPVLNFEMHRALFGESASDTDFVPYFKDYLNKAPMKDEVEHYLTDEDFYIYFTAHSYKHFHNSGCGIRTLIDYYLYLSKTDLDFAYIDQELEKLNLVNFSHLMISLSKKAFNNEPLNEEEEETLLYIASSGTYGTMEHSVAKGIKKKGKFGYFMSRVFPPYRFYKSAYPWAYYCPILIPFAWLARFLRILFKNPKRATNELKTISKYKKEDKQA